MRYTSLEPLGLTLSRLAFGCAPVMGRVGKKPALRAMHAAYEHGVTHFDVARSYGYGEAEAVLGEFAAGKRDRITIATKFGIQPARGTGVLGIVKPAVRALAQRVPAMRRLVRAASGQALVRGHYDVASARTSVETSLSRLNTDYVDLLLIHEPAPGDELTDELLAYLDRLREDGSIRAWGLATRRAWTQPVFHRLAVKPALIQCEHNPANCGVLGEELQRVPAIFHSPFGGPDAKARLRAWLSRRADALAALATASDAELGRFLLEYALHAARDNVVLCSMFDPAHLRDNLDAVDRPVFGPQAAAFHDEAAGMLS